MSESKQPEGIAAQVIGWRERRTGGHVFEAGPLVVVVDNARMDGGLCVVRARAGEPLYADTLADGIDAANARLHEVYTALRSHFAPLATAEHERDEAHKRATCSWCEKTAVCAGNDEGDPWALSCDEHCAHGGESGSHIYLSDHAELIALVNSAYAERDEARAELAQERADLAALTSRVEAVRAQTIAECVALLSASAGAERSFHREMMANNEIRDGMQALAKAHALERAILDIRTLAATQPASEDAGPSWAWDESLGCFAVRFSVVELRAFPDGRWWIWESEQSRMDGMAGSVREAMLAAVARERQDTRHRSDVPPEVHAALARLEAQLVPLVARAALSQPAPTESADVDPAAGALR